MNLAPPCPNVEQLATYGNDARRLAWKGFCCPKCGRLNCRELWTGWLCQNCGYSLNIPRTVFKPEDLVDVNRYGFDGPAIPGNKSSNAITCSKRMLENGVRILTYQLGNAGTVTHLLANSQTNARPFDADWIFQQYQAPDVPFKRHELKSHKCTNTATSFQIVC